MVTQTTLYQVPEATRATLTGQLTTVGQCANDRARHHGPSGQRVHVARDAAAHERAAGRAEQPAAQDDGQSGELQVILDKADYLVMYEVAWTLDPVAGPWTDAGTYSSTRGIELTGLTRGKAYFVHVRATASGQNVGAWSDLASAMVV